MEHTDTEETLPHTKEATQMASSIGGNNFHISGQKSVQPNRNIGAPKGNEETSAAGDEVQLSAPQTPVSEKQTRQTTSTPAESTQVALESNPRGNESVTVRNAPDRILMSDVQTVSSYKAPSDGSGVSGLNSLQSVVSTGMFVGLSGEYGQRNLFGN